MEQFKGLLRKNLILYRRNWFGSFIQIFIPILFALFFLIARLAYPSTVVPAKSYAGQVQYTQQYYSQQMLKQYNIKLIKSCTNTTPDGELIRTGVVALGPPTDPLAQRLNHSFSQLGYNTTMYQNNEEINRQIASSKYGKSSDNPLICFSVFFESPWPNYTFRIRFNISDDISSDGPATFNPIYSMSPWNYHTALGTSRRSGLFQVNNIILNTILQNETNNQHIHLLPTLSPMGHKQYVSDDLFNFIKDFIDIFTLFPCIIIFLRMTSTMLKQKEKKIRQIMKVMGMSSFLYYATWVFRYFVIYLIAHLATTLIFYFTFQYVSFSLIFVTYLLFDLVLIVQSLFVQTFFIDSVLGTLTALTLFFIQYIGSFVIKSIEVPQEIQLLTASICPYTALVMIMEEIFYSNFSRETVTWSMFNHRVYNYRVSIGIASLLINILVWGLLTVYFEKVFPNQEGIRKHPLFLCGFPRDKVSVEDLKGSKISEGVGKSEGVSINEGIYFEKVWKIYNHNSKVAVKDLTLQIERNSVFTLLGHNGAGKTTTLSMMAGITSMTQGDIYIQGKSIKDKSQNIKQIMGFCPQHNTLYDQLTVQQHLKLFSNFKKAIQTTQSQLQIQNLLKDLELTQKRDEFPNNLSGGQKRRLQLALAFVGGSKIIFLDQPTSGLDSYSRRKVWSFIRKKRAGKIIILTTHFMDEAEILSDQLGIMKDGRLVCCGTPHGLKKQFELGYKLSIEKQSSLTPSEPIISLVRAVCNQIQVQSTVPSELVIRFPTIDLNKFAQLFESIDKLKQELKIRGYGVNTSTLEEVLLTVTGAEEVQDNQFESLNSGHHLIKDDLPTKTTLRQIQTSSSQNFNITLQNESFLFFKKTSITIKKRIKLTLRNIRLLLLEIIIPSLMVLAVFGVQRGIGTQTQPSYEMTPQLYKNHAPIKYVISSNHSDQVVSNLSQQLSKDNNKSVLQVQPLLKNMSSIPIFDQQFSSSNITEQISAGVLITSPTYTNFHILANTHSVYSPLVSLNTISQSIINIIASSNISITPILDPLPFTKQQKSNFENPATSFLVALIFSISLSYKYSSSIYQVVKQRESNCKHLQIISGMDLGSFWIGNFIFDFSCFVMFAVFSLCMCKAFDLDQLIGGERALEATAMVLFLYGICQQIFTYVCSFLFIHPSDAQSMYYFFNFLFGSMMPTVILVFRYIGGGLTKVGLALAWIFRFIPSFSFGEALINLESRTILSKKEEVEYTAMNAKIALYDIYFLGLLIPLLIIALVLIEVFNWTSFGDVFKKVPQVKKIDFESMDMLVMKQMLKTQQIVPSAFPIVLKNATKVYQNGKNTKVAVNHLNLVIQKGQVFGLLGVNGAGKSTTFKMLTRDILATSGEVYLNGHNIEKQFEKVKVHIGYCPQFCALFENLTVREQLQLYYRIKGFSKATMKHQIDHKLRIFDIKQYQNVLSKDLSGGNQRKLSMAIALIGNPSIVLLDQPSTGVDPYSKRFMWKIINSLNTDAVKTTVVLTTHSMQQAQYLSTRIGIMQSGNFKCLGSLERIKNNNSDGFFLQLKLKKVDRHRFRSYLDKLKITQHLTLITMITSENVDYHLDTFFAFKQQMYEEPKRVIRELCATTSISLYEFLQRMVYEKQGQELKMYIMNDLTSDFKDEHDCRDWRFKIREKALMGKAIVLMEKYKDMLDVEEYHVNSTTLEDILNKLSEKEELEGKKEETRNQ